MSFEPDHILRRQAGNNADALTVNVRVMNGVQPTSAQLGKLQHAFKMHKLNVQFSPAGFLVRNGELPDGSRYRIVSNSGKHDIMIWPVSIPVDLATLPWGVFCIPADTTHQFGWVPPAVPGTNGTTGSGTDRTRAGAFFKLHKNQLAGIQASGVKRFQEVLSPSVSNVAFFPATEANNTSEQNSEHREWVAPDRKAVVTTHTGTVQLNGVDFGKPPEQALLWACVVGKRAQAKLFAVGINGSTIKTSTRKLNARTWTALGSFDLSTLDAEAATVWNGYTSAIAWVKKVQANASLTTCSLWVQSPNATASPDATRWVGVVDINMDTGAATSTPATSETLTRTVDAHAGNATWNESEAWSGARQISFHYDGDTKVFTDLAFSGALTLTKTRTATSTSYSLSVTKTDTRKITFRRGTFTHDVFSVTINEFSCAESASFTPSSPGSPFGPGTYSLSTVDESVYHSFDIPYFGGQGNVCVLRDVARARRTVAAGDSAQSMETDGSNFFFSDDHTTTTTEGVTTTTDTIYVGETARGNGAHTRAGSVVTSTGGQLRGEGTSGAAGSLSTVHYWGAISTSSVPFIVPGGVDLGFGAFAFNSSGHPRYDTPATNTDRSYMNGRAVDEFVVFSVPRLTASGTLAQNPADFHTYCSDPAVIEALNVDATLGVLKGIRLK